MLFKGSFLVVNLVSAIPIILKLEFSHLVHLGEKRILVFVFYKLWFYFLLDNQIQCCFNLENRSPAWIQSLQYHGLASFSRDL